MIIGMVRRIRQKMGWQGEQVLLSAATNPTPTASSRGSDRRVSGQAYPPEEANLLELLDRLAA